MSLDILLTQHTRLKPTGSGIFIRENGQSRETTREEWDAKFPGTEPIVYRTPDDYELEVFWANITHNLGAMADAVLPTPDSTHSLYGYMWTPDELYINRAVDLIEPLTLCLAELKRNPEKYKAFNPTNGWGDYDLLVEVATEYLEACQRYPDAEVSVSR